MSQKLAIAISGAVSLGSYEAGVMYEIIEAIRQHNTNLQNDTTLDSEIKEKLKIEIDVITGASAGAMTACILAQKLMFEGDKLTEEFDNDLYLPWVKEVDINNLIDFTEKPDFSILSSVEIQRISEKYLLGRYDERSARPQAKPHLAVGKSLYLGLAMANLNGVSYKRNVTNSLGLTDDFVYSQFKDRYLAKITSSTTDREYETYAPGAIKIITDNKQSWELIEQLARSSGSFPFAFRPVGIERKKIEYPKTNTIAEATATFTYSDGGVFENEPLGMAEELASRIDESKPKGDRFYLFVAPKPKSSVSNQISQSTADLLTTAEALIKAIFNQARFRDWILVSDGKDTPSNSRKKIEVNTYSVTADDEDLVGEGISAFVGFFEEDYRQYDYFKGRDNARKFLNNLKSDRAKEATLQLNRFELNLETLTLGETTRTKEQLETLAKYPEKALDDVDRDTRKKIKKLLLNRLDNLIDLVYENRRKRSPFRWLVKKVVNGYLSGKIDEILQL